MTYGASHNAPGNYFGAALMATDRADMLGFSTIYKAITMYEGIRMNNFAPGKFRATLRYALALTVVFSAANVYAQSLRVTAANSSSPNAVYDVLFNPAQTTLLNSDGAAFKSFHSLVFVSNAASGGADLLVADTTGGSIVRYFAPTGTPTVSSTVVWSGSSN